MHRIILSKKQQLLRPATHETSKKDKVFPSHQVFDKTSKLIGKREEDICYKVFPSHQVFDKTTKLIGKHEEDICYQNTPKNGNGKTSIMNFRQINN